MAPAVLLSGMTPYMCIIQRRKRGASIKGLLCRPILRVWVGAAQARHTLLASSLSNL